MVAIAAVLLALALTAWAYGVYCYVQMVRHRRPDVPAFSMIWPAQNLTQRGLEYRRRTLLCYGVFAVLAFLLIFLGRLSGH
ncbi:MAG TPA: hypothetical protein VFH26_07420 [Gemmatimonadales bacterium]|nr:hypothetical protein [Gemmatimonadales bacterium]